MFWALRGYGVVEGVGVLVRVEGGLLQWCGGVFVCGAAAGGGGGCKEGVVRGSHCAVYELC
eukprot:COSAG02_NODE_4066_length_5837_cov_4.346114_1_plen_61_part_00